MTDNNANRAVAIVGMGAILPDAPNVASFWKNVKEGRYSISDVSPERWKPQFYYDADPTAPDKTYSKIGGWVREYSWEPVKWHLPIPPKVVNAMDEAQKWALVCTREALDSYGYTNRNTDANRVAVILGNAMAGEKHYLTSLRLNFPEYACELAECTSFHGLSEQVRKAITNELRSRISSRFPEISEDTMPGELANCLAGRIANTFNFRGPNFVVDAACASAMAAVNSAIDGLIEHDFDLVLTGGIDRNMGAATFIKFCKIGALSPSGTRPYAEGADGFVMGEGAAIFVLKRLEDAERDKDTVYAVVRAMGGSSDGKGKGITAPNPIGQKIAIERAWHNAGVSPATATLIEGHGTSTRVGDMVEVNSLAEVLASSGCSTHSVALGSVKSNIGHLKGAAGAAGLLKTALALHEKVLPPSVRCEHTNPDLNFDNLPVYVNTALRPWTVSNGTPRRAGVSAFGFGGTNFHAVLEEYIPSALTGTKKHVAVGELPPEKEAIMNSHISSAPRRGTSASCSSPLNSALVVGAESEAALLPRLNTIQQAIANGRIVSPPPTTCDLRAAERIAIDYSDANDLSDKCNKAMRALGAGNAATWKPLRAQGIFRGSGPSGKIAFLYTGQGSQYVNMLRTLRDRESIVADTFAEADRVMKPLLGKPLTEYLFIDESDANAMAIAEEDLRQTAITQPAVLATDIALTRLLASRGIHPDMVMGHSLGEYAALVTAGVLSFEDALEAVSARGREMTRVAVEDNGRMAAVFAPINEVESLLKGIDGYVVIANINSNHQSVIGGASVAVEQAIELFSKAGHNVVALPVSHAFHTSIVAPASAPLRKMLQRLQLRTPRIPIIANVTGDFYPTQSVAHIQELLGKQIASPVQFVKGLRTLYDAGARVFVEVGPKKALQGFVDDVFESQSDVVSLFTNHPKIGDVASFNQALCGLYAAGVCAKGAEAPEAQCKPDRFVEASTHVPQNGHRFEELGRLFAEVIDRSWQLYKGGDAVPRQTDVVITGAALGLPGTEHIFDDENIARILRGDQFIDTLPTRFRRGMLDKHITRLVKSDNGGPTFETITDIADVIKLAARGGAFELEKEFGVSSERVRALDRSTALAIAAGIDALRDAGIPLVMRYKKTSKGTLLPDRWSLPDALRDDTGVIFASAFPGYDAFAEEITRYHEDRARREQLTTLENLRRRVDGHSVLTSEIDRRIQELRSAIDKNPYNFNRRFLFRALSMGHSQFAELTGARGPNTQVNAACASTTQAIAVAEDWIRAGRCKRVVVVSADDATSDNLIDWLGAGFLASGAAATDDVVENAAIPFDRRRHGMIIGMGAAALVLESAEAASERGLRPICDVLSTITANSAFHGTRLDVEHISSVMETLLRQAEERSAIRREEIAPKTVFVSHETYTPARGGSASAEIHALRRVFGDKADQIVIANTKGLTGHAMGTGVEDVVAVKALETSCVPPVANFKEIDPELGPLNLSKGGIYPVEYALRLGAGFGSQISMALLRFSGPKECARPAPTNLGYQYRIVDETAWKAWLSNISGQSDAELQVSQRTLRVRDKATAKMKEQPTRTPAVKEAIAVVVPDDRAIQQQRLTDTGPRVSTQPVAPESVEVQNSAPPSSDQVKERVLALVAEKTGYPVEMLDLDLDMEADLGVDTVKLAEVFASIRTAYNIAREESVKLRDFPTLAHVIRFVLQRMPKELAAKPAVATPPPPVVEAPVVTFNVETTAATAAASADSVKEKLLDLVEQKTGYPREMLDLDLDLEADLGIDTVKQAELFSAIREEYGIPRDENRKLRDYPTLAHVIRFVCETIARKDGGAATADVASPPPIAETVHAETTAIRVAAREDVAETVLAIVAQKTGYPKEMLDLDLDLEADLGIDTVKQAEVFASVRAALNIPRDQNLKLRDFPTLAHVIQFAREKSGLVPSPETAAPINSSAAPVSPLPQGSPELRGFEAANSVPRRVPVPVLRPPLELCKPTGVTLGAGSRVVVMPDNAGVAEALSEHLKEMGVTILRLDPTWDAQKLTSVLREWSAEGPVQGIYWLPALDDEGLLTKMNAVEWHELLRLRVKLLFATMRGLYDRIGSCGTFLVSATRLGGQHGYGLEPATSPLGGSVAGFTKAYKRERSDALVKVVDFAATAVPEQIAASLIDETLRDPGGVEIGYCAGLRWTVGLQEQPATDGKPGMELTCDSVFVVTGAAGSIVSAITADLASASGGTFYLLDVVPKPSPDDPDLKRFVNEKDGLKRELFARIQARGERATPALVEKQLAALERAQAAQSAIDAVHAAGGQAHYISVDLTDYDTVSKAIDSVRAHGRIDVLLHAAGLERSHFLNDKDPREFDLVFDVKSSGFFNLLRAIGDTPLGATVAFSSIAGRFGNAGQTDYSAANDLLCKITSTMRRTHPATRSIAIDWTAWAGVGMATRGSIPKMMEAAGIDMLSLDAGIPLIRRELTVGGTRGEVLIGERLGILTHEWDESGGVDPIAFAARQRGPMVGRVKSLGLRQGITVETTLDPKAQPFLRDHQIDGTPVLPGVMGVEAFAEATLSMLPGWNVSAIEDVRFIAPFKFYRNEARTLTVEARFVLSGDEVVASCKLLGDRLLAGQSTPQTTTHFEGRLRLTRKPLAGVLVGVPVEYARTCVESPEIYRVYFHGPAYQVVERAWIGPETAVGQMQSQLTAECSPVTLNTVALPRLIELCFQTAGLWEIASQSRMGLPHRITKLQYLCMPPLAEGTLVADVRRNAANGTFDAKLVDSKGNALFEMTGYETVALPQRIDADSLKAPHTILAA